MSSKRSARRRQPPFEPLRLEGEPGTYFDPADLSHNPHHERKTTQLCAQVAEAVHLALAACHDPRLASLFVEAVDPAPTASRLRVVVSADRDADGAAILDALAHAGGFLRRQVAGEVNRKRVPQLSFVLTVAGDEGEVPS
ncbi:MAG: ribosome-binding factor A [Myxococcota bacterium]